MVSAAHSTKACRRKVGQLRRQWSQQELPRCFVPKIVCIAVLDLDPIARCESEILPRELIELCTTGVRFDSEETVLLV